MYMYTHSIYAHNCLHTPTQSLYICTPTDMKVCICIRNYIYKIIPKYVHTDI